MKKVTALIPDELLRQVRKESGGKTITESLLIALSEFLEQRIIRNLHKEVKEESFQFQDGFSAYRVRKVNRKKRSCRIHQFGLNT